MHCQSIHDSQQDYSPRRPRRSFDAFVACDDFTPKRAWRAACTSRDIAIPGTTF
jgi:hypothetical protein